MDANLKSETRSTFVTGLRNAHAMENQALSIMRPQVERIENYPEVAERLRQHIAETEGQIKRLEDLLEGIEEDSSTIKDTVMSAVGSVAAMGHSMAGDEILKNSFANFAFENYEIAAYKSLITLGRAIGYDQATDSLQQSLEEEQAMATWLDQNLEAVTLQYAHLKEAGEPAKS
ncbi:MAG: ferritin-like domain-containing protein [Mesorhizobium sp.]|uniref:ferritin-like domain-containing protein n=1 Tax=Mesorhizobium sp. TaxID=1871066 RepID=UPI000FE86856|nr:ferritin-like domain-containing protein [Mesorhizobium sp.]RWB72396.1 MAG: ferritin-like domain-containing protein [Mesorhizobium sp.]